MPVIRTIRKKQFARFIALILPVLLLWMQIAPVLARAEAIGHSKIHLHQRSVLRAGLTDTPSPALRAKIAQRLLASSYAVADVHPLSMKQMRTLLGRGMFRSPYYCGTLPWQKSFHDVNLSNGNLFKNFTDLQVSPGRGAGLTLNRTYNSNDATVGPFGVGWTHAYDIELQETQNVITSSGDTNSDSSPDDVPRKDFFGAYHTYHRDADGLYSPPPYMYDNMNSDYGAFLAGKPVQVVDDTDMGKDGTIKHYTNMVTNADGTSGDQRYCDYIQDRHGNRTTLTYGLSYTQADGSTRKLLTSVTDPDGRSLQFTWNNLGSGSQPAYRITQVQGPFDPNGATISGVTETVAYGYYTDPTDPNELYDLHTVTLDPAGLDRVTTYAYTSAAGQYYDSHGNTQTSTELGLLSSITDPLGRVTSYTYTLETTDAFSNPTAIPTGTVWVSTVTTPDGVNSSDSAVSMTWNFAMDGNGASSSGGWGSYTWNGIYVYPGEFAAGAANVTVTEGTEQMIPPSGTSNAQYSFPAGFTVLVDGNMRCVGYFGPDTIGLVPVQFGYDSSNNVVMRSSWVDESVASQTTENWTYGPSGDMLTHSFTNWPGTETYTYYNADKYFQKATETDMDGHVTTYDYYTDSDSNPGNRGEVKLVQDPGYADSNSPSYNREYTYTYNQYGQKASETNLNGVTTNYTYGDNTNPSYPGDLGNLVQVVQDYGSGHLNRTTSMDYDWAGHVLNAVDPAGNITQSSYNILGQPNTVKSYAASNTSTPAETIGYAYDTNGRTTTVSDNRGLTSMSYEPNSDWVQAVTDPVTGTLSYTYNIWGERTSMSLPGGGTWTYSYTPGGNDILYPYPPNLPAPSPVAGYGCSTTGGTMTLTKADDFDSLAMELQSVTDDAGRTVNFTFNPGGHIASQVYDQVFSGSTQVSNVTAQYSYDSTNWNQFQPPGEFNTFLPGTNTHYWLAQLTSTFNGPNPISGGSPPSINRILQQSTYAYDTAGMRTQYQTGTEALNANGSVGTLTNRTESYTYDDLSRLSTVNYGDGESQSYSFDPMGNRLGLTDTTASATTNTNYGYDAANRLTGVNVNGTNTPVSFDADGNTLADEAGRTFTWDSENRMTGCTLANGNVTSFTYGADGLRRSMTVISGGQSQTTDYVWDGSTLIREMQVNNGQYAGPVGSLISATTYFQSACGPAYRRNDLSGSVPSWYVYNGLGSVVGEVDPAGNYTASQEYDVYGNVRSGTQTGSFNSRQGYVGALGHETDPETGNLIYMQARYYDPGTGRFDSEDPKQTGDNWYIYVSDQPSCSSDSSGKDGQNTNEKWVEFAAGLVATWALKWIVDGFMEFIAGVSAFYIAQRVIAIGVATRNPVILYLGLDMQTDAAAGMLNGILSFVIGLELLSAANEMLADADDIADQMDGAGINQPTISL